MVRFSVERTPAPTVAAPSIEREYHRAEIGGPRLHRVENGCKVCWKVSARIARPQRRNVCCPPARKEVHRHDVELVVDDRERLGVVAIVGVRAHQPATL